MLVCVHKYTKSELAGERSAYGANSSEAVGFLGGEAWVNEVRSCSLFVVIVLFGLIEAMY